MNIFNRTPSISEDTLHYAIYPPPALAEKLSVTTLATYVQAYVSDLLPHLLWHRDPFEVKIAKHAAANEDKWLLEGHIRVGDSVDDEWCAVWLLREISKKWDLAISVLDADGEFLLIEAAEALPSWIKPSNSENRVWIYSGMLHLIPLQHTSLPCKPRRRRRFSGSRHSDDESDHDLEEYLAIDDALKLVRDTTVDTRAPHTVESTVWQRISGYPSAAQSHVHTAKAYLPLDIARALSVDPSLVQKPVETFYTRDTIQLRAAHRMTRFPPRSAVLTTVKITRPAYAQLIGQKFFPPKVFGQFREREGTDVWRWRDIGMKLACGFEMIYQESKIRGGITSEHNDALESPAQARKDALRQSSDYKTYIINLVSAGYFRDEVEESQLWNELENKAVDAFIKVRQEDDATRPSFAALFNSALSSAPEFLPDMLGEPEDSDDWMNVDPANFDNILEQTRSQPQFQAVDVNSADDVLEECVVKEQASKLQDLAARVQKFVEGEGDAEGARFEDEAFSDDDGDADEEDFSDEKFSDSDDDDEVVVDEAARQEAMAKLVPALSEAEYGQMPASFNTQRVSKATIDIETADVTHPAIVQSSTAELASKSTPHTRAIRPPILARDKYEGVDSDDESSDSDPLAGGDEEDISSEEDRPQLVGDVEVDMEEEEAEFLEFSRQALGISDEQWENIIEDRKVRGAFIPNSVTVKHKASASTQASNNGSALQSFKVMGRQPDAGPRPNVNPNLDSFEAAMQAMDVELERSRQTMGKAAVVTTDKGKSKLPSSKEVCEEDLDIEVQMEAELKAMLEGGDREDLDSGEAEAAIDYNLIKNFLESFKSQAGLSGPVGNLAVTASNQTYINICFTLNVHHASLKSYHDTCRAHLFTVNTSGIPRLTKFYTPLHQSSQTLIQKIFSLISIRPAGLCNFLDAPELEAFLGPKDDSDERWRVVYRNYATLYFVFVVDGAESELGILDLIQVFVEALDRHFENVCELDLVFHFDEAHHILAEIIQGGLVLETNGDEISNSVKLASKARRNSFISANPLSLSSSGGGPRSGSLQTPLGWLTDRLAGVATR